MHRVVGPGCGRHGVHGRLVDPRRAEAEVGRQEQGAQQIIGKLGLTFGQRCAESEDRASAIAGFARVDRCARRLGDQR